MSKINITDWHSFKIHELFYTEKKGGKLQVPTGAYVEKKLLTEGTTPRITVTGVNNGICGYFNCDENKDYRKYKNFISVSFLGTVFYHKGEASLDMKVHCLKPLDVELNEYTGLFIVTAIIKSLKNSSYADQISSTVLPELGVSLPVDNKGFPDYVYMENYIKELKSKIYSSLNSLFLLSDSICYEELDTVDWDFFKIRDLFNVVKGSRLTKVDMREGSIRYIGASSFNNGITTYISNDENIHPSNTLTVCYNGSDIGRTFYQDSPYWATDDVNVLYPKFKMTKNIGLFLAPVIKCTGGRHVYKDKWKIEDMKEDYIKLPVTENGVPDFMFMESFMEGIEKIANSKLDNLKSIL